MAHGPEIHPAAVLVADPLSEVTRKERRSLLATSAIGVLILRTGLVPERISTFGIEFSKADQTAVLRVLAIVVLYFLVAFVIYAFSDFVSWRITFRGALREAHMERVQSELEGISKETKDVTETHARRGRRWTRAARPTSWARTIFEFLLPVLVGSYAVIALLSGSPPPAGR
jgi:hypothetical protein